VSSALLGMDCLDGTGVQSAVVALAGFPTTYSWPSANRNRGLPIDLTSFRDENELGGCTLAELAGVIGIDRFPVTPSISQDYLQSSSIRSAASSGIGLGFTLRRRWSLPKMDLCEGLTFFLDPAVTVDCWFETKAPALTDAEVLLRYPSIASLLGDLYEDDGRAFLVTPLSVFNGHTALELLNQGEFEEVEAVLAADLVGIGY
jgi:hypothetical protein